MVIPRHTFWKDLNGMKTSSIRALTSRSLAALSATAMAGMTALSAAALPQNGGISMLPARSPIAEEVHVFHNWILMPIMTAISVFVLGLLGWIVIRYNSKANPKACLLYTSPSPRDRTRSRMPSSA